MKTAVLRRRRMSNHIEVDSEGSWAISYGDMVTLLLSFFILFFSADPERDRMNAMEQSLFSILTANSESQGRPPQNTSDQNQTQMTEGTELPIAKEALNNISAQVHLVGHKLIIEFPKISFYNFSAIEVTAEGKNELRKFSELYLPYVGNYILNIQAFTDHKKVLKGQNRRFQDNLELSALRSVAAMRVLQHSGIPLSRMRLGGQGELLLRLKTDANPESKSPTVTESEATLRSFARKVVLVIERESRS